MRKTMSGKRAGLLVALCLLGMTIAPWAEAQENPDATPLRVGLSTSYPPVAFEKDGQLGGLEVDLARAVGAEIGKPIEFKTMEFKELIPALQAKKIDVIMSGMSVTEERAKSVDFVQPYMRVGQMALVSSEEFSRFADPGRLNASGAKIGFVQGTTGGRYVAASLPKATKVAVESADKGVAALRDGSIDLFIHDAPTIWRVSLDPKERELLALYEPLTEEYLAWGVRKDDPNLKGALDGFVTRWKENGQMDSTVNKWIPVRVEVKAQ
ncbi:MAG: transporter substrate-binding domain-containing protein [Candidatus Binatia bacterium]|nr:transporter substrate-binding domain-containing protein [Candidatus Binatia bacterium]